MLGAIIGDIVGSVYEWYPIKTKDFPFLTDDCFFTDDSVCTVAVADILLHDLPPAATLQAWCRRYPDYSYGGNFGNWLYTNFLGNAASLLKSERIFIRIALLELDAHSLMEEHEQTKIFS